MTWVCHAKLLTVRLHGKPQVIQQSAILPQPFSHCEQYRKCMRVSHMPLVSVPLSASGQYSIYAIGLYLCQALCLHLA